MEDDPKTNLDKQAPSRPNILTVIGLVGLVIGFFVMVLTVDEKEISGQSRAQVSAPTQQVQ